LAIRIFTTQVDLKLRGWSVLEKAGLAGFAGADSYGFWGFPSF